MSGGTRFGGGGLQHFFFLHVEKIVLGAAVVVGAVLFAAGYTVERLPREQSPDELLNLVKNAERHINGDTWEIIKAEREAAVTHKQLVETGRAAIDPALYPITVPLTKDILVKKTKRVDPKLYPPIKLEVYGATSAVAYRATSSDIDELAMLPEATLEPEKKEEKARAKPATGRRPMGEGSTSTEYTGPGYESTAAAGVPKRLSSYWQQIISREGFQPQQAGSVIAKGNFVVSIRCLAPLEQQTREFENALGKSVGYNPARDIPKYIFMEAERAEEGPALTWRPLTSTNSELRKFALYPGVPEELVEPMYTVPQVLTFPAPPIMFQELKRFMAHSETPIRRLLASTMEGATEGEAATEPPKGELDLPGVVPPGGETGMIPGVGMPPAYMPPGTGSVPGYSPPGYAPYGEGSMPGMTPGMSPGMAAPKYLLVRFFDTTAEPGKSYRYRARLWLQDPNSMGAAPTQSGSGAEFASPPSTMASTGDPNAALTESMLENDVVARLAAVREEEKKLSAAAGRPIQITWRKSDWSEPSEPLLVPNRPQQVLLAGVTAARESAIPPGPANRFGAKLRTAEEKAKMLAVVWDEKYAVNAPGEIEVERGAVLNFTRDVEVLHPVDFGFRKLEKHSFDTDVVLLDVLGGEILRRGDLRASEVTAPGQALLLDEVGRLMVRDEFSDIEDYRRQLFIDDADDAKMMGGSMPGYEMPSDGKASKKGKTPPGPYMPPPGTNPPKRGARGGGV